MSKILLVEEKKDEREFITKFLRERNFEVLSASNGIDALFSVKRHHPDLVLLELDMSDLGGIKILRHMRKIRRRTKVIALTRLDDIEIINDAKKFGVVTYLTKPVILNELLDIISKNLGKRASFFKFKKVFR